jgi:ribosomal 30S subunit maturation factor RimM
LGLEVQNTEGKKVGKLADFYETAAHTVFVIKTNRGELVDVPYVEAFFKDIDLDNSVVTVEMPEEME